MFKSESRRKKKLYRKQLIEFKEKFEQTMMDTRVSEMPQGGLSWNTINLWATAIMMDEARTLSRLTRWLIMLSAVLSVLTFVLAYPLITGVFAGIKVG